MHAQPLLRSLALILLLTPIASAAPADAPGSKQSPGEKPAASEPAASEPAVREAAPSEPAAKHERSKRWALGGSAWMVANLLPDPPQFYYLELNRWFDEHNALVIEPVTWTYAAPIGIPYGSSLGDVAEEYPGYVRSVGLGLGWRYDFYRGLNASARAINFLQIYSEDDQPRQTGYQLFLQGRLGWRWASGVPGIWIEPSLGFNWWPIETGRPDSFRARDERWPSYFLFEPWLNLGWQW